jgi:hypothetical protein
MKNYQLKSRKILVVAVLLTLIAIQFSATFMF